MDSSKIIRDGVACAGVGIGLIASGISMGRIETVALIVSIAAAKVISEFINNYVFNSRIGNLIFPSDFSNSIINSVDVRLGKQIVSHMLGTAITVAFLIKMELIKAAFLSFPAVIVGGALLYAAPKVLNLALCPIAAPHL